MKETRGDLFELANQNSAGVAVITTNGFIKRNGHAVMGRGCALKATQLYPGIAAELGEKLKYGGNTPHILRPKLITFPVKPSWVTYNGDNVVAHVKHIFTEGENVPGWAAKADPDIIRRSAKAIVVIANTVMKDAQFYLPRPGCGAGELCWEDVKPILSQILDDRFTCCSNGWFEYDVG